MKGKIIVLAIVLIMILSSFGAVGTQISNEDDCGCSNLDEETIDNVGEYKEYYLGLLPGDPLPPGKEFPSNKSLPPSFSSWSLFSLLFSFPYQKF